MPRPILATFTVISLVYQEDEGIGAQFVFPGIHTTDEQEIRNEIVDDFRADDAPDENTTWEDIEGEWEIDVTHYRAHEVQTATRKEVRDRRAREAREAMTLEQQAIEQQVLRDEIRVEEGG